MGPREALPGPENPNGVSQSAAEAPEVRQPGSQGQMTPLSTCPFSITYFEAVVSSG